MSSPPPEYLGPYRLIQAIGQGGMGEVFLAERSSAHGVAKRVVVKRIKGLRGDDLLARERFVNEARIAMRLDHGNIVQVFDFGEEKGQLYLVMEWVEGPSLFQLWREARRQGQRIPFALSAFILRSLLSGLHFAHEQVDEDGQRLGIVHRDVSPQNVLVGLEGQIKLTDFGIARARDVVSRTRPGILRGKLVYFSPEQMRTGAVDRRTDLFASGVIFYQLLTGALPILGEVATVRRLLLEGGWARASMVEPALPPELEEILEEAMAVDPDQRFSTAEVFKEALDLWLQAVAPGTGEQDLADYLSWIYRDTDEGRQAAALLHPSYPGAMQAWQREMPATDEQARDTGASGTSVLGGASRKRRRLRLGLGIAVGLGLLVSVSGWWFGRQPGAIPTPESKPVPAPAPPPTAPTPEPRPAAAQSPPARPPTAPETHLLPTHDEAGHRILREGGEHSLLPEGGTFVATLSALSVSPDRIAWKTLPLARRGTTRVTVDGEVSLGGLVPRRLHSVIAWRESRKQTSLHILRPAAPLLLRGRGQVWLAIADPEGQQDNVGLLEVVARARGRRLGRVRVDAMRDAFRADGLGGVNLRGIRASGRYRLAVEAPDFWPPVLWIHSLQAGVAVTNQGKVDGTMGLLRGGESAVFFGAQMLTLVAITRQKGDLHYRISITEIP